MNINYYEYQACDSQGKIMNGYLSADTEREVVALLKARKLTPVLIKIASQQRVSVNDGKITSTDLISFSNGLCTLIEARVSIDKALSLLEGISEKESMKRLVVSLRREVKEGKSLAGAMEMHTSVFSKLYINIIRAGEEAGILEKLLPDLVDFLEKTNETKKHIISALTYPLVLAITGFLSVALLLIFVVPQFSIMFENVGTQIPASAEFLLSISHGLKFYGWLLLPFIFLCVYAWRWVNAKPERKQKKDAYLLTMPVLGAFLSYKDVAVFSRTLGALLSAGIPLLNGLRLAREVVTNEELVAQLQVVEKDVRGGMGLGMALEKTRKFPVLLHQLVTVGEESGRTGEMLLKLAITFDTYVKDQLSRLVSALQPALILLLGFVVGGIIIVMLSAVFSMNTVDF